MLRSGIDRVVEALAALRAGFDNLLRDGEIRPCGCAQPDCPVFMLSDRAAYDMDRRRRTLLELVHSLNPDVPSSFYALD